MESLRHAPGYIARPCLKKEKEKEALDIFKIEPRCNL
jgi:hypothetical protein